MALAPDAETVLIFANPVQPHSEGEIVLKSADPLVYPKIRMNYLSDPHDLKVVLSIMRKALEIAKTGPMRVSWASCSCRRSSPTSTGTATATSRATPCSKTWRATTPSRVYHLTTTCRSGDVVDTALRVRGVQRLRVADASIMPDVISGNTNASCTMISEKAAELLAREHGVTLAHFVGS